MLLTGTEDALALVHALARAPNPHVVTIMGIVGMAIDYGAVHIVLDSPVPLVTFALQGDPMWPKAAIMVPRPWRWGYEMAPYAMASRFVHAGSLAVDYFNGRYLGQTDQAQARAQAYEAEYLFAVRKSIESFDSRQQALLSDFGEGVRSQQVRHLIYEPSRHIPLTDLV